jgi:hypothetical protein
MANRRQSTQAVAGSKRAPYSNQSFDSAVPGTKCRVSAQHSCPHFRAWFSRWCGPASAPRITARSKNPATDDVLSY